MNNQYYKIYKQEYLSFKLLFDWIVKEKNLNCCVGYNVKRNFNK